MRAGVVDMYIYIYIHNASEVFSGDILLYIIATQTIIDRLMILVVISRYNSN
jgi:hypothetical protein